MKDPYEVLGVSRTASDNEIKSAYRELVKKYHPDNYANNPLADLASEKMKEINEAYDAITKSRSGSTGGYQSTGSSGSYQSGYQSYNSYNQNSASYAQVRSYINANQLDAAESMLNTAATRDAEWYFLKGSGDMATGWKKLKGTWYYFDTQGRMYSNAYIDRKYFVGENGAWDGLTIKDIPSVKSFVCDFDDEVDVGFLGMEVLY